MHGRTYASRRSKQLSPVRQRAITLVMRCALAMSCILIGVPVAYAQTCVGRPGPEGGRVQLGADYASTPGTDQTAVSIGGVGSRLFGQVATITTNYDGTSGYAWQAAASLGFRVPLATGSRLELCPIVSGAFGDIVSDPYNRPPNEPPRRRESIASTRGAIAGVAVGYRVSVRRGFTVIPSVSANVAHASLRQTNVDVTNSNTYGLMGVSVGVLMGTRFTASPYVWVPVGLDGAKRSVGLAVTLSLWQKRSAL